MRLEDINNYLFYQKNINAWIGFNHDNPNENGEFFTCKAFNPIIDNYIDVGAKKGDFLKQFNDCNRYAFEPDKRNCKSLGAVGYVNKNYVALSNRRGKIKANRFVKDNDNDNDYFIHGNIDSEDPLKIDKYYRKVKIKTRTLDSYKFKMRNAFLKIDVDGMEWKVIQGAKKFIENTKNLAILFEYSWYWKNHKAKYYDVYRYLRSQQYIICRITSMGLIRCDSYFPKMEDIEYCNYLAFRNLKLTNEVYKMNDVFGLDQSDFYSFKNMNPEWG